MRGFFEPLENFDAYWLHRFIESRSFHKMGWILCCRTDSQIRNIKDAYQKMYGTNLLEVITARCKSSNKRTCKEIFENLLQCKRMDDSTENMTVSYANVHLDCMFVLNPPAKHSLKMELARILTTRTWKHIRCLNDFYNRMSANENFEQFLASADSGDSAQVLMCILQFSCNPVKYFSDSILSFGGGDSWRKFGRLVIPRAEIDLKAIDCQFSTLYKKRCNLVLWMERECSAYPPLLRCLFTALLQSRDQKRRKMYQI